MVLPGAHFQRRLIGCDRPRQQRRARRAAGAGALVLQRGGEVVLRHCPLHRMVLPGAHFQRRLIGCDRPGEQRRARRAVGAGALLLQCVGEVVLRLRPWHRMVLPRAHLQRGLIGRDRPGQQRRPRRALSAGALLRQCVGEVVLRPRPWHRMVLPRAHLQRRLIGFDRPSQQRRARRAVGAGALLLQRGGEVVLRHRPVQRMVLPRVNLLRRLTGFDRPGEQRRARRAVGAGALLLQRVGEVVLGVGPKSGVCRAVQRRKRVFGHAGRQFQPLSAVTQPLLIEPLHIIKPPPRRFQRVNPGEAVGGGGEQGKSLLCPPAQQGDFGLFLHQRGIGFQGLAQLVTDDFARVFQQLIGLIEIGDLQRRLGRAPDVVDPRADPIERGDLGPQRAVVGGLVFQRLTQRRVGHVIDLRDFESRGDGLQLVAAGMGEGAQAFFKRAGQGVQLCGTAPHHGFYVVYALFDVAQRANRDFLLACGYEDQFQRQTRPEIRIPLARRDPGAQGGFDQAADLMVIRPDGQLIQQGGGERVLQIRPMHQMRKGLGVQHGGGGGVFQDGAGTVDVFCGECPGCSQLLQDGIAGLLIGLGRAACVQRQTQCPQRGQRRGQQGSAGRIAQHKGRCADAKRAGFLGEGLDAAHARSPLKWQAMRRPAGDQPGRDGRWGETPPYGCPTSTNEKGRVGCPMRPLEFWVPRAILAPRLNLDGP